VFDLPQMAGADPNSDAMTVLTDTRPSVDFPQLDLTVHGFVFATKRAPASPLAGFNARSAENARTWQVGMIHGSMPIPGKFDQDDVLFTEEEVAASGLDYLALGHWHSARKGKAGQTTWAFAGAPEPVALDQDGAGQVLIVDLDRAEGRASVTIQAHRVGRTKFEKVEIDAAGVGSQADIEKTLRQKADPDTVLDVRLLGVRADTLDLHIDELDRQLQGSFLRLRIRDSSVPALSDITLAPADTIVGAFARDLAAQIKDHDERGEAERAAELREALRLGLLLLDEPQRVTLA
jgi:exonuclease SbcD